MPQIIKDGIKGSIVQNPTWTCKIGVEGEFFMPSGCDAPMRAAVERAFLSLVGVEERFNFSCWGAELTKLEESIVENRDPTDEELEETIGTPDPVFDSGPSFPLVTITEDQVFRVGSQEVDGYALTLEHHEQAGKYRFTHAYNRKDAVQLVLDGEARAFNA